MVNAARAHAVVTVQLEVALNQPWGEGAALEDVFRQGKDSALEAVRQLLAEGGQSGGRAHFRLVGEVTVRAVVEERGGM